MIDIRQASSADEFEAVRSLVRAFMAWLRDIYPEARAALDQDFRTVEAELALLPGAYQPPDGELLLAYYAGTAAGTVALQRVDDELCEMQRLFVDARFRGKGIG